LEATTHNEFQPAWLLRNAHLQSMITGLGLRRALIRLRPNPMVSQSREYLLDCGEGVRLQGFHTPQPDGVSPRGLVVMLHGWEGSSRSNYILSAGARLFDSGFNVFRLNFRDHGDTHRLNPGVFHSCRPDEVLTALGDMQARIHASAWGVAGFSLGGNFALRVALKGPARGLAVARSVAICPVLDPDHVLKLMESGPTFYESYYNRKWASSLRKKQEFFPDRYDYEGWFKQPSMRERTRFLATRYYGFDSLEDYFQGYSVAGQRLAELTIPSSILMAADDPVVPVGDIDSLPENPRLEVEVTAHGGHCGYLKNWKLESWAEDLLLARFNATSQ